MTTTFSLRHPMLRQFVRFGLVGVANTATCLAIVWTSESAFGLSVWLASALGYAVAMVQSYLVNRNWTFGGGGALPVGPQIVRFVAVNVVMGTLFSGFTNLLAPSMGVRLASVVVLAPLTVLSFLATRHFVFAQGKPA